MSVQSVMETIKQHEPACPSSSPAEAKRWLEQRMDDTARPGIEADENAPWWHKYWRWYLWWQALTNAMKSEVEPLDELYTESDVEAEEASG